MTGIVTQKNKYKNSPKIFLLVIFLLLPNLTQAAIVFETNFDSNSDWNADKSYEGMQCSVLGSGLASQCNPGYYPSNWDGFRAMPSYSGKSNPSIKIGKLPGLLPDKTGSGKAVTIYNDSYPGYANSFWPGDGILSKYLTIPKDDIYVQFWFRTQSNWKWAVPATYSIKFFRVQYWPGINSQSRDIYNMTDSHPTLISDFGHWSTLEGFASAYRCDPNDYYCSNVSNTYQHNDYNTFIYDTADPTRPDYINKTAYDGQWHKMSYHLKMNSITNGVADYNGIFNVKIDNTEFINKTNVVWRENTSLVQGWNLLSVGGNSYNPWYYVSGTGAQTITTGAKTFTIPTGLNIQSGVNALIKNVGSTDTTNTYLRGAVTSYNSSNGQLVVNVDTIDSAPNAAAAWNIYLPNEQWYAIDDVVVSTTPIPADYVIGGGTADTTAPNAPSGLSVQ